MTTASDVLRIAKQELGTTEGVGNDNETKYGIWYGIDGDSWCAIFVSYCFYKAGLPLPAQTEKGFAYCPLGLNWFKSQNLFFTDEGKPGDIVFFDWELDGEANHVAILDRIEEDGTIVTIDGNSHSEDGSTPDLVQYKKRPHDGQIMGFGRPVYNQMTDTNILAWNGQFIGLTSPHRAGDDIKVWQEQMIKLGYNLGILDADGIFTQSCHDALQKFQADLGLTIDGILGGASWQAAWNQSQTKKG